MKDLPVPMGAVIARRAMGHSYLRGLATMACIDLLMRFSWEPSRDWVTVMVAGPVLVGALISEVRGRRGWRT